MNPKRRKSIPVLVGSVTVGGEAPIVVQSMTNTDTADVAKSVAQVKALADAGSELVRLTVNVKASAAALPKIKEALAKLDCHVPLIGDFHYNGHILLGENPDCAKALDKYRINPGNVGFGPNRDRNYQQMIELALKYDKPVRIGVNWGSLDPSISNRRMDDNAKIAKPKPANEVMIDAMIESAMTSIKLAKEYGMNDDKIIISVKMSHVQDVMRAYTLLANECGNALHVGLTEAGMGFNGAVASACALGNILQSGIGDTIRVSLTPAPNADRTKEVEICQMILQSLNLRQFRPSVTACPGCGRTTNTLFQEMAQEMEIYFKEKMPQWIAAGQPGVENLKIAVMGCIVNGPGESKQADIGISLPGSGENPKAPVFIDGKKVTTLEGPDMMATFKQMIDEYVAKRFQ